MLLLIVFLSCLFVALGAGVLAGVSDIRGLIIPNSYSLIIAGAFIVAYAALWLGKHEGIFYSFSNHFMAALLVFGITAVMFALNAIGAADSKMASVFSLWVGMQGLIVFLFYMTLAGGALGIAALVLRKWKLVKNPRAGGWVARVQAGESKVPYGVAIAVGALASFVKLGYFDTEALRSFLLS